MVGRSGTPRQSRHFRIDGALAGSIAANSAALTSAIRPSLAMHLATAMKPSGRIRLQPHEFEVLAQSLLVLTEAVADLAQTLPRLGGVGPNRRQDPEQPLGRGEVTLRCQQLAEPVQRVGVLRLNLQNPPIANLRIDRLSLAMKFGRLLAADQGCTWGRSVPPRFLPLLVSRTME